MPFSENSDLSPDLDLAFEADNSLAAALLAAAGDLADPLAGAELWHERISQWLEQVAPEPVRRLGRSGVMETDNETRPVRPGGT